MGKWITKSYVILILLITMFTGKIMVKAQEESRESMISMVLKDDKTKRFLKENQELLQSLRDEKDMILYSMEPYQEYPYQIESSKGNRTGIFLQMIQLFEQITQVTFQQVSEAGNKEELMVKLGAEDIDILLGLTMSSQTREELAAKNKECKIVAFEEEMFLDPFVLIGQVQEEEYTEQMLPYYYWGSLEDQYVELTQTELMNHTVTYNSCKELEEAYQEGTIQGMFITQGRERYYTLLDKLEYANIREVSLEASKYYCIAKNDETLNKLLPKMIQLYISLYDEYFFNEIPVLEVSHKELELRIVRYLPVLAIGTLATSFLTGIVLVMKRHQENKKMLRLLKQIPNKIQKEQEVLFILIKKSKIRATRHFQVFGLDQKHLTKTMPSHLTKTMRMQELTKQIGFDFRKHYAFLAKNQEKEFTCCFELYIRGVAYSYEEVGIYQEEVIVSKIYRKEK